MAKDVFPSTLNTWIDQELDRGTQGRLEVNAHIMNTYAEPLRVYFLGTNARWLGEPDDVVGGFFADRLARDGFFAKWQASDLRLRRWLMNAFCFYLQELRRQRRRDQHAGDVEEPVTFSGDPDDAVDKAAVLAFVRRAMDLAADACRAEGLDEHWQVFLRHHVDGRPFADLAPEFGVDSARAAVMSRTAARKFRGALREVLVRDGVPPSQVDREIESLLEISG